MSGPGAPRRDRPQMPPGYGVPDVGTPGALPWAWVAERLTSARHYWVSTTRPDGRPHAMPVWGIWADEVFRFGTDRGSRKARNLSVRPAAVVHLESGEETVILEGLASEVADAGARRRFEDAFAAKYDTSLAEVPGDVVLYEIAPTVAFAWRESEFPTSTTRYRFAARR